MAMDTLDPKHLVLSSAFSTEPHGLNFERIKDFEILKTLKETDLVLTLKSIVDVALVEGAFDDGFFGEYAGDSGFGWKNRRLFTRSSWFTTKFISWQEVAAEFSRLRAFTSVFQREKPWTRLSPSRYARRVEEAKTYIERSLNLLIAQKSKFVPKRPFDIDERLNNLADSFYVERDGQLMATLHASRSTLKAANSTSGFAFRGEKVYVAAGRLRRRPAPPTRSGNRMMRLIPPNRLI